MISQDIQIFKQSIDLKKPIIGIDPGRKKMGIAISVLNQTMALPYTVYHRQTIAKDMKWMAELINDKSSNALVIGLPATVNEWHNDVKKFAKKVAQNLDVNVYLEDETLSTKMALEKLQNMKKRQVIKIEDMIAASIILQQTLDKLNAKMVEIS